MTAYYNEYDPKAAARIRELVRRGLVADGAVDERSILDVQPEDLRGFTQCHFFAGIAGWSLALRLAGWADSRPCWTGSPPCQPFSAAGRQKGQDDERHLAPHFAALVAECRPPVLFGEQVASAAVFGKAAKRTGKAPDGDAAPEWAWLDDLFERLEAAHYACGASDIPAAGVGAAHIRQRTFFGAQRLDDPASPRHDGPFSGPEGLARNETWLRLSGAGSGFGGVADAPSEGLERRLGATGGQCRKVERFAGLRADGGLADDDDDAGLERHPRHGDGGREPGRVDPQSAGPGGAGGGSGGLADTLHAGRPEWRPLAGGGSLAGGSGGLCGLADPRRDGAGSQSGNRTEATGLPKNQRGAEQRPDVFDGRGQGGDRRSVHGGYGLRGGLARPDATDSPWGTADWLFCRDGKWRPVEARAQPLVDGLPAGMGRGGGFLGFSGSDEEKARAVVLEEIGFPLGQVSYHRVARLRGYGTAIVPAAAAEFIKAFDAASDECFRLNGVSRMATDEGVFG